MHKSSGIFRTQLGNLELCCHVSKELSWTIMNNVLCGTTVDVGLFWSGRSHQLHFAFLILFLSRKKKNYLIKDYNTNIIEWLGELSGIIIECFF